MCIRPIPQACFDIDGAIKDALPNLERILGRPLNEEETGKLWSTASELRVERAIVREKLWDGVVKDKFRGMTDEEQWQYSIEVGKLPSLSRMIVNVYSKQPDRLRLELEQPRYIQQFELDLQYGEE